VPSKYEVIYIQTASAYFNKETVGQPWLHSRTTYSMYSVLTPANKIIKHAEPQWVTGKQGSPYNRRCSDMMGTWPAYLFGTTCNTMWPQHHLHYPFISSWKPICFWSSFLTLYQT